MNHDFQDVLTDVKAQHPDKVFVINNLQRYVSAYSILPVDEIVYLKIYRLTKY